MAVKCDAMAVKQNVMAGKHDGMAVQSLDSKVMPCLSKLMHVQPSLC